MKRYNWSLHHASCLELSDFACVCARAHQLIIATILDNQGLTFDSTKTHHESSSFSLSAQPLIVGSPPSISPLGTPRASAQHLDVEGSCDCLEQTICHLGLRLEFLGGPCRHCADYTVQNTRQEHSCGVSETCPFLD
jgi:hypothetical protein